MEIECHFTIIVFSIFSNKHFNLIFQKKKKRILLYFCQELCDISINEKKIKKRESRCIHKVYARSKSFVDPHASKGPPHRCYGRPGWRYSIVMDLDQASESKS